MKYERQPPTIELYGVDRLNYLKHYGKKGMHWGVRNYQNKDGSLTAAGKERYRKSNGETEAQTITRTNDYFNNESNRGVRNITQDFVDVLQTDESKQILNNFMDGKYNKALYETVVNEFYPYVLESKKDEEFETYGDYPPGSRPTKSEFAHRIRSFGFSGGWVDTDYDSKPVIEAYVNLSKDGVSAYAMDFDKDGNITNKYYSY